MLVQANVRVFGLEVGEVIDVEPGEFEALWAELVRSGRVSLVDVLLGVPGVDPG